MIYANVSMWAVQWGDVSSWVSGVGSLLAVIIALSFAVLQRRELETERLRSIYAWVECHAQDGWYLVVNNLTQFPVYEWSVSLQWTAPGGLVSSDSVSASEVGLMLPGLNRYAWSSHPGAPAVDSGVAATITFVDASGDRFERSSAGALKRRRGSGQIDGV